MKSVGPLTVSVDAGAVFDYFDEVRKVIEAAKLDLLFVDPYLDAEFVSRYLPHAGANGVTRVCRSLTTPANGLSIEVRSALSFHDRYVFVDRSEGFHSGASYKDGAKKAPTTLTQIVDAFPAVLSTYEQLWSTSTVHS